MARVQLTKIELEAVSKYLTVRIGEGHRVRLEQSEMDDYLYETEFTKVNMGVFKNIITEYKYEINFYEDAESGVISGDLYMAYNHVKCGSNGHATDITLVIHRLGNDQFDLSEYHD